jgi:hypothetical protein
MNCVHSPWNRCAKFRRNDHIVDRLLAALRVIDAELAHLRTRWQHSSAGSLLSEARKFGREQESLLDKTTDAHLAAI